MTQDTRHLCLTQPPPGSKLFTITEWVLGHCHAWYCNGNKRWKNENTKKKKIIIIKIKENLSYKVHSNTWHQDNLVINGLSGVGTKEEFYISLWFLGSLIWVRILGLETHSIIYVIYYHHLYKAQRHSQRYQVFYTNIILAVNYIFWRAIIKSHSKWELLRLMFICVITYITNTIYINTFI